ncbi:MAG: DegQ family serine endoprotease [bacterium]|nr:DegQ family serine endoprotease [bacterium]
MKKTLNRTVLVLVAFISISLGMLFSTLSFYRGFKTGSSLLVFGESNLKDNPNIQNAFSVQNAFRLVAKSIIPAVVNISTEIVIKQQYNMENDPFFQFFGKEWFDFYFGDQPRSKVFTQKTLGTGVIVDDEGYILTNFHVVKDASKIIVKLSNGKEYKAKVIGTDEKTDLALIKIEAKEKLYTAPLGDSDELEVGDWAIAVGNPFGLNETFTVGVISAKGRSGVIADSSRYENYIQTDASINPGNSGGPLINIKGEVVGINTAIATPSGGNVGIGFAIPIKTVKTIFKQLKDKGKVIRGWLGVSIQDLNPDLAKHFKREPNSGVLVADVLEKTPAADAGLKGGDIIIQYGDEQIKDVTQLRNMVAETAPGSKIKLRIIRKGEEKSLTIKIAEMQDESGKANPVLAASGSWLGLKTENITAQHAGKYNLGDDRNGVIITSVDPKSPAAGLQAGDVIKQIDNTVISNLDDFNKFSSQEKDHDSYLFVIKRQGRLFYIAVDNEKTE